VPIAPEQALQELARRAAAQQKAGGVVAAIRAELFDKQVAFLDDRARLKGMLCTRRSGKTAISPRMAVITALQNPRALIRIWAQVRLRAKQLVWQELLFLCARHKIPVYAHETELTLRFNNGAEIRLVGADKDKDAQRKRGDATTLEVVLEAQSWGPFLRSLVEDVAGPSLFDNKGTLCLEGTPGPLPTGYWFYVSGENDKDTRWISRGQQVEGELVGAGWSLHRWSLLDNPMMPRWRGRSDWREEAKRAVKEERDARGWSETHPTYIREYLGRWVRDDSALYYAFDERRNTFDPSTHQPWGEGWNHVLGLDIGWQDATALVAWGFHREDPTLYEAFSWARSGVLVPDVIGQLESLRGLGLNIVKQVADIGGGGRLYVEDMQSRFGVHFEDAQKSKKYDHVLIFNGELLSGRIKLQRGSQLQLEMAALPKDPDWDPLSGKPPGEDPRFDNHCCDAGLYSQRAAWNYLSKKTVPKPKLGTLEELEEREKNYVAELVLKEERKKNPDLYAELPPPTDFWSEDPYA
jgi:hypothetical protein